MKLFSEIRRRKVARTIIAYAVAGWLMIQLAIALESALELPSYVDRWVTIGVIAGFPIAVILSWVFDISFGGIRRTQDAGSDPTASTLGVNTEAAITPKRPTPKHSIAVLPFVDMSPDKDQAYLGDGVAEEILNGLVQVRPLKVSGRTSSFSFKHKDADIKEIGDALSVAHVLEGSVRKQGDKVRITAQLIKADDGFHLWSETYDGDLQDIFDLQDNIAKAIVSALELVLDVDKVRLVSKLTSSPEAYDLYLRGRKLSLKQDGKGVLAKGIQYLEGAVALDPDFAQAWSMLAFANFWVLEHTAAKGWQDNVKAGKKAAYRSFDLDKSHPHALGAMYLADVMDGRLGQGIDRLHESYQSNPYHPSAQFSWGALLAAIGRVEEGRSIMSKIIEKDPMSASLVAVSAHPYWAIGDIERAKEEYLKAFRLGFFGAALSYAFLLSHEESPKKAVAFFNENYETMGQVVTRSPLRNPVLRYLYVQAAWGRKKWARYILKITMSHVLMSDKMSPSNAGPFSALYFGDAKLFFEIVRRKPHPYLAASLMNLWLPAEETVAIRTHKEFPQFAQDIGLVQAWQTYGWPKWVQPKPGTDGSELQFTVT